MAIVKLNPIIKSIHGRIGKIIFYNVGGYQYARSYTIPRNPRTKQQQKNRICLGAAVKLWQNLSPDKKSYYNRLAKNSPLSGYNLFISMQMKGIIRENIIEFKHILRYNNMLTASLHSLNTSVSVPIQRLFNACSPDIYNLLHAKPPGSLAEAS